MKRVVVVAPRRSTTLQVATTLPADVRTALVEASLIDAGQEESIRRVAAINRVTAIAKMKYPRYFR